MKRPHRPRSCRALAALSVVLALLGANACSSGDGAQPVDAGTDAPLQTVFGGARQVLLEVPASYGADKKWPLVIVLHGYGATGYLQKKLLGFDKLVDDKGFLLAAPDGLEDSTGKLFWNATDACCDFDGKGVDDVAYLTSLIDEISAVYAVDADRVYLIGHSNGGYMSYRMACDQADRFAAIISLAGATYGDPAKCKPTSKVSVVQIHGDKDETVGYEGGTGYTGAAYPGAFESAKIWAGYDGCASSAKLLADKLDLDSRVAGAETKVERFEGCPTGVDVELWTMVGGSHVPFPTAEFSAKTWAFFAAHPKQRSK